jgi:hypothetical protein
MSKSKKGSLTLNKLEELYQTLRVLFDKPQTIKWWQWPFLWFLPSRKFIFENFEFTLKKWNGVIYLVSRKELKP